MDKDSLCFNKETDREKEMKGKRKRGKQKDIWTMIQHLAVLTPSPMGDFTDQKQEVVKLFFKYFFLRRGIRNKKFEKVKSMCCLKIFFLNTGQKNTAGRIGLMIFALCLCKNMT